MTDKHIARVAVPAPLFGLFDYRLPDDLHHQAQIGARVRVPFGRQSVVGVIMAFSADSELDAARIRSIAALLDEQPLLNASLLQLLSWAADYYQHPLGEVIATALPKLLRQGEAPDVSGERIWTLTSIGAATNPEELRRAPRQAALLTLLQEHEVCNAEQLNAQSANWRKPMQALIDRGLVGSTLRPCLSQPETTPQAGPELNDEQQQALQQFRACSGFNTFLLQGITGSGKTEIYLSLVQQALQQNQQVLVLVPEISLTPQLTERFQRRLDTPIAALHSALNGRQRLCAWQMAAQGKAGVVIGTRSALFTPLPRLGLIIVDEEHDGSLKQQDGFRYHARDLALVRARNANVPVLLGSATPSLESLFNVERGLYRHLQLTRRAAAAKPPSIHVLDMRRRPIHDGLSDLLLAQIERHLQQQGQVLLFLNRRGYAPLLMCHECGWTTECPRCDAHMTLHQSSGRIRCHHCGHEKPAPTQCPSCAADSLYIPGAGTERIEQALLERFPDISISRIDRDTTRRKGELDEKLEQARSGEARILIGTQMLAKGHDFPNVTLVGILDTDQGLFSSDFRATEHMAQLIVQVAGRAGRAERLGEVYIQTHHPDHPLLQILLEQGYPGFASAALAERQQAQFPPFSHLALIRAEAPRREQALGFLGEVMQFLQSGAGAELELFGPLPAPMEKRAGRFRAQLIIQAEQRKTLHGLLRRCVPQLGKLKSAARVRWSLDVDPQDMY